MKKVTATISVILLTTAAVQAEDRSNAELAAELANPNTSLGSLNFPIDYTSYKGDLPGAGSQESWKVTFQPVLPYPVADGMNVFFRPAFPLVYKQPVPHIGGGDIAPTERGLAGT